MRFASTFPHVCLSNARVQAFAPPLIDFPVGFRGGPVLERDEHQRFRHLRDRIPYDSFRAEQKYADFLDGEYIYAGPISDHFGHFMSEMVHRIVPSKLLGLRGNFLFVTTENDRKLGSYKALPDHIRQILGFLGIDESACTIINSNTIVSRLHVVEQASCLGIAPKPAYLYALRQYASDRLDAVYAGFNRPKRIYVSRSGLPKAGGFLGEAHVESEFRRSGFTVFHPEAHSVPVQMDHYRKADCIVFPGGSACHGVELLGTRMLNQVVLIPRLDWHGPVFENVLKPRAVSFSCIAASTYLGTLVRTEAGGMAAHRGVSLLDPNGLAAALRMEGIELARDGSMRRYLRAAALDLAAYGLEVALETKVRDWLMAKPLLVRFTAEAKLRGSSLHPEDDAASAVAVPAEGPSRRVLTPEEVAEIWAAANLLPYPFGPFYRMAMLTLQRRQELVGMRWSEISADLRIWCVPAARSKSRRPNSLPLAEPAREILAAMPRGSGSDLVFASHGRPISGFRRARQALDLEIARARREFTRPVHGEPEAREPWFLNDFRQTSLRRLEELGFSKTVVRRLLDLAPDGSPPINSADEDLAARMEEVANVWASEVTGIGWLPSSPSRQPV